MEPGTQTGPVCWWVVYCSVSVTIVWRGNNWRRAVFFCYLRRGSIKLKCPICPFRMILIFLTVKLFWVTLCCIQICKKKTHTPAHTLSTYWNVALRSEYRTITRPTVQPLSTNWILTARLALLIREHAQRHGAQSTLGPFVGLFVCWFYLRKLLFFKIGIAEGVIVNVDYWIRVLSLKYPYLFIWPQFVYICCNQTAGGDK